jgi:hypothetical protein
MHIYGEKMKRWHVKVNLEFDVTCDEDELSYMIKDNAQQMCEELDVWDDEVVEFEPMEDCE